VTLEEMLAGVIWTHAVVVRPASGFYDWEYMIWRADQVKKTAKADR